VIEQKQKDSRSDKISAQYAELLLSPGFRQTSSEATDAAHEDGELYAAWRQNMDEHLGGLATTLVDNKDLAKGLWAQQRQVALGLLEGKPLGPFADYVYKLKVGGRGAEVSPSDGDASHLPPGEFEAVETNNRIRALSKNIEEPLEFLRESLDYTRGRRQKLGNRAEGPENYATALKYFTDKTFDYPLIEQSDRASAKKLVGETIGNFLRIGERDEPNIIEITNLMSSIKNLPPHTVDKRFSAGILKHVLQGMEDFSQEGVNLFIQTLSKLDTEECSEAAAMSLDLALRKGAKFERSGDMLAALRAIDALDAKTNASERAFTTLLDVRSALEVSSSLDDLRETNKLLHSIVRNKTESPADTLRAKAIAEYVAHRAVDLYKNNARVSSRDPEPARQAVASIIRDAKAI